MLVREIILIFHFWKYFNVHTVHCFFFNLAWVRSKKRLRVKYWNQLAPAGAKIEAIIIDLQDMDSFSSQYLLFSFIANYVHTH